MTAPTRRDIPCAIPGTPLAQASAGIDACVHCGFCLQACPTYLTLEDENDSPRGRIVHKRALVAGTLPNHDPDVRTHIDHFGTGASPLRMLHRFPGDAIKISPALVAGIGHDAGAFEIVRAVVGLAHNLDLEVIAEGVSQREQLDYLKVLGCEFAQGAYISATLDAAEAGALLESAAPSLL